MERNATFTYEFYRELLRRVTAEFEPATVSAFDTTGDRLRAFVRHDIDVSVERAVKLAEVEHDAGVAATYMVLTDSPLYDLDEHAREIRRLADLGHEVGLHYDLTDDDGSRQELAATVPEIAASRDRLASVLAESVDSVSFHRPTEQVIEGPGTVAGMVNAYREELLEAYLSDSMGRWREGPPVEQIDALANPPRLQILTHPVWWGVDHRSQVEWLLDAADSLDELDDAARTELENIYPDIAHHL